MVFSDKYINENKEIVSLFLSDLVKDRKSIEINITSNEMAEIVLDVLKYITNISVIRLLDDAPLSFVITEKVINLKNIKHIECYSLPAFMMELLDKNNVTVVSRSEVLFTTSFMQNNSLNSFSDMYYKKDIVFGDIITDNDIEDFRAFCNINKYLKVIHFDKYSSNDIKRIANELGKIKKKNIIIQIHDDINDTQDIEDMRKLNKQLKKSYNIKLTLVYSKDYLEKNYFKQMIFITLKYCSIIIFLLVGGILSYLVYNNYHSEKKVNQIMSEVKAAIESPVPDETPPEEVIVETPENEIVDNNQVTNNEPPKVVIKKPQIVNSYDKLLPINPDTVGWLKVNGTKIDYPVVQTTDNKYYLSRNFYKEKDYNGWVFMDYRNTIDKLHRNTIIYAHNRYTSGVMFGTLNKVLQNNWHMNESNLYITFNTLYENNQWKVFSVYGIDVTSDYLYTKFTSDERYQEFLDMIKNRSQIQFNIQVTTNDKILTLSTCLEDNQRLVVHAVRVIPEGTVIENNEIEKEEIIEDIEKEEEIIEENDKNASEDISDENVIQDTEESLAS